MKDLKIWSYNENSEGAKALGAILGAKRIKHNGSTYVPGPNKSIINWGDSQMPQALRASKVINSPNVVGVFTNKLKFFELIGEGVRTPDWTTDAAEAIGWMNDNKTIVVCRKVLTGHSGAGIVIAETPNQVVAAPLYTKYVPKKEEYRVHFVGGKIIDVQQKKMRDGFKDANFKVRSHANGFVFCRGGVAPPADVIAQAEATIAATGLDFGAIDIVYNEKQGKAYVLEVNTAPGLEGETVQKYAQAFKEFLNA